MSNMLHMRLRLLMQLAEEDGFDSEKDAASVAYNAAVKGAAKVHRDLLQHTLFDE